MKKQFLSTSNFGIFIFLILLTTSCKNEKKDDVISKEITEEQPITFNITVDIKIKKDDDLIIYYKDGSNEWIVEEKAVWNSVKGSDSFQKVVFNLPEDVVPNDFRFDVGRNEFKAQEPIEIRSLTLSYYDNSFVVTQDMFNTFFKPNQYIKYDEATKQFSLNKVDGNYDPYFETAPEMYPQISKVVLNN